MPEAYVLETLRTARTKASPRGGFANIARTATMLAGWGDVPGVTINRFCASGIDAVAQAAARIRGHGAAGLGVAVLVERAAS